MQRKNKSLVFIDWINLTVLDSTVGEIDNYLFFNVSPVDRRYFENRLVSSSYAGISIRKTNERDVTISLSGSILRKKLIKNLTSLLVILKKYNKEVVVSRLDLAHYDYYFFDTFFRKKINEIAIYSRSKKTIFYQKDGKSIETLILGKRGKGTYLRIYNKWLELNKKGAWVRQIVTTSTYNVELELHRDSLEKHNIRNPYNLLYLLKKDRIRLNYIFYKELSIKLYIFEKNIKINRKVKLVDQNIKEYKEFLSRFKNKKYKYKTLSKKALLEKAEKEHLSFMMGRIETYIHQKNITQKTIKKFIQQVADKYKIDNVIVPIFQEDF